MPKLLADCMVLALVLAATSCDTARVLPKASSSSQETPSAGGGLLYYSDPVGKGKWVEIDWNGHIVRSIQAPGLPHPSPSGKYLLVSPDLTVLAADGTARYSWSNLSLSVDQLMWSDDDSEICLVAQPNSRSNQSYLYVAKLDSSIREVTSVPSGGRLLACSGLASRAVIVETRTVRLVDLTNGGVRDVSANMPNGRVEVVSHDGSYAAVGNDSAITVVSLDDGHRIATLHDGTVPLTFSWNHSTIVINRATAGGPTALVSLSTGINIWPSALSPAQWAMALPRTDEVLVASVEPESGLNDLTVLADDGSSQRLATNVWIISPCPC